MVGLAPHHGRRYPGMQLDIWPPGAGLFSKKNPKLAVLAVLRGPMKKIRPLCLGKWGVFVY